MYTHGYAWTHAHMHACMLSHALMHTHKCTGRVTAICSNHCAQMICYAECQQWHGLESYTPSQASGALWMALNEWMWETCCHVWLPCCLTPNELKTLHCWSVMSYWWETTWKLNTESQRSWLQKCSDWGHCITHGAESLCFFPVFFHFPTQHQNVASTLFCQRVCGCNLFTPSICGCDEGPWQAQERRCFAACKSSKQPSSWDLSLY